MKVKWYPSWVYDKRVDVTQENMRLYDKRTEEYYAYVEKREKELGRKLTLQERYDIRDQFNL